MRPSSRDYPAEARWRVNADPASQGICPYFPALKFWIARTIFACEFITNCLVRREGARRTGLASIPLALLPPKFSTRILTEDAFKTVNVQLQVAVEMDSMESLQAADSDGQIATIVPETAATGFERGNLIPITQPELSRQLSLPWPKGAGLTRAATTFAGMLKEMSMAVRKGQKA